ncbi:hypothetical protein G6F31_020920 [Rhizopus arrhizus]|nr:hypothetical protein G6F31_020920 [Rhizopus arrhizus]
MTEPPCARAAAVRSALTSLPAPGSVIARDATMSPWAMPGRSRRFWLSVPKFNKYGATMSECVVKPVTPVASARAISSTTMMVCRKSPPPPPYSSGVLGSRMPAAPALRHRSRGTRPSCSH